MKTCLFVAAACAVLILAPSARAASPAAGMELVLPPDKSYVEGGYLSVFMNVWQTMIDEVQISVNDKQQDIPQKRISRFEMCYDGVRLNYGMNTIKVSGFKKGRQVGELTTRVFFRSDFSKNAAEAPAGYRRYLFHKSKSEKLCRSCHNLDFRESGDVQEPEKSPCYRCHKTMLSDYKLVHGPTAVWSCPLCHSVNSRDTNVGVPSPVSTVCFNCHDNVWEKKKYQHGPTAAGSCTTCHNPHGSGRMYFLRAAVFDLCSTCHEDIQSRPHVISSFSGNGGHPLRNRPDPSHPGSELTCASCHNPHGENSPAFLNGYDEKKPRRMFCTHCH